MSADTTTRIDDPRLPEGWHIERLDRYDGRDTGQISVTELEVYEPDGPVWKETGNPRSSIDVEIYWAYPEGTYRKRTDISWPSTSDKRPVLARALSVALALAVEIVDEEATA